MLFLILYSMIIISNASSNRDTDRTKATTSRSTNVRYIKTAKKRGLDTNNINPNLHIFEENVLTSTFTNNCQVSNEMDKYLSVAFNNEVAQEDYSLENIDNIVSFDGLAPLNSYLVFPCSSNPLQSKSNSLSNDIVLVSNISSRFNTLAKNQVSTYFPQNANLTDQSAMISSTKKRKGKYRSKNKQIVNENPNDELDWLNDLFFEKQTEIQETKKHPKITIPNVDLDLELLNSKGKLEESLEINKIMVIMRKSLKAIDLYIDFLEEEIRESLNTERITKYFIYNYFFDDNLKIRNEYLFLLLNIPEINNLSLMYESLENKPTLHIPNELVDEFVKSLLSLINEYKKAIKFFIDNYKIYRNISVIDILIFFGNRLYGHIKNFRTINEKVLNELFNLNLTPTNSACSTTKNKYAKQTSPHEENFNDKIAAKKQKKVNVGPLDESICKIKLLTFYYNLNDHKLTETQSAFRVNKNFFISAVFLNNNWLKCFSPEKTNFEDIKLNNVKFLDNKMNNYYNDKNLNFNKLHNNIYEFLKLLYKKYFNVVIDENNVVFRCQGGQIYFEKPIKYQTTVAQYINYIFGRYSEVLLQYYIEMNSE